MTQRATALHQSPWLGVFHITGGGVPLLGEILSTPGASATVLEATVPYAQAALEQLLGQAPEQATSSATARMIAMAAYQRAVDLESSQPFGFGCTASLGTNRVKRGEHRAHWAIQTAAATFTFYSSYAGERADEEALLLEQMWASINYAMLDMPWQETATLTECRAQSDWHDLLADKPFAVCTSSHDGKLLLPGSFNPIHEGHRELLSTAEQLTGKRGAYEIAVKNADKPTLDFLTIEERLVAMSEQPVWLTNLPTFQEKALYFPGATFALGVDTIERVGQLRFYDDDPKQRKNAFATLTEQNIRFLVFGRLMQGEFKQLSDIQLPSELRELCEAVPETTYRSDLSSTAIRSKQS